MIVVQEIECLTKVLFIHTVPMSHIYEMIRD